MNNNHKINDLETMTNKKGLEIISESILNHAKIKGRTLKWVSEQMDINYKTLIGKLKRDSFTAYELLKISDILNMDLYSIQREYKRTYENEIKYNTIRYNRRPERERIEKAKELINYIRELKNVNYDTDSIISDLQSSYSNVEIVDLLLYHNYLLTVLPNGPLQYKFHKDNKVLIFEINSSSTDYSCVKEFGGRMVLIKKLNKLIKTMLPIDNVEKIHKDTTSINIENTGDYRAEGLFFDDEIIGEIINAV